MHSESVRSQNESPSFLLSHFALLLRHTWQAANACSRAYTISRTSGLFGLASEFAQQEVRWKKGHEVLKHDFHDIVAGYIDQVMWKDVLYK